MDLASRVFALHAQGFDRSRVVEGEDWIYIRCSQCDAIVINGVPCHESGCPNIVRHSDDNDECEVK